MSKRKQDTLGFRTTKTTKTIDHNTGSCETSGQEEPVAKVPKLDLSDGEKFKEKVMEALSQSEKEKIAPKWRDLGLHLEVDKTKLDRIKGNDQERLGKVIVEWYEKQQSTQWEAFAIALDNLKERVIADRFRGKNIGRVSKRKVHLKWDDYFMAVALLSKREVSEGGACIINEERKTVATAYSGKCVCHAEINTILMGRSSTDLRGCVMYTTRFPCNKCAQYIIQSGIQKVIFMEHEDAVSKEEVVARKHEEEEVATRKLEEEREVEEEKVVARKPEEEEVAARKLEEEEVAARKPEEEEVVARKLEKERELEEERVVARKLMDHAQICYKRYNALMDKDFAAATGTPVEEKKTVVRINLSEPSIIMDYTCMYRESPTVSGGGINLVPDEYFMAVAFLASLRSKDPHRQVGACVVKKEFKDDQKSPSESGSDQKKSESRGEPIGVGRIVGIGYNGLPHGCSDDDFPWQKYEDMSDREKKHKYVA